LVWLLLNSVVSDPLDRRDTAFLAVSLSNSTRNGEANLQPKNLQSVRPSKLERYISS
jgi:hypothetical protein